MKKTNKLLIAMAFAAAGAQPAVAQQASLADLHIIPGVDMGFYGSLRLGYESVQPDKEGPLLNDYTGFRDAYSRVGFKASTPLNDDITASIKYEVPLDLANGRFSTPDDPSEDVRVAKFELSGDWGSVWVGQDWLPYYNAIAYKVDSFDSYYSGFATFAAFRRGDTIAFNVPVAGLNVSGAYSEGNQSGSSVEHRTQLAVTKDIGKWSLAAAVDQIDQALDVTYYGLAASYTTGPWYVGAKYETVSSDKNTSGFNEDGSAMYNVLVGYTSGLHLYQATVAQADGFGESIFHAGWRYQFHPKTRVFVEYYSEEETAAIAPERKSTLGTDAAFVGSASGGQAITVGIRYDF